MSEFQSNSVNLYVWGGPVPPKLQNANLYDIKAPKFSKSKYCQPLTSGKTTFQVVLKPPF